ncbi:hypothetical protein V7S43_015291 [Phytophthora oleae]|uniref:Uncharacterized protein n=1 Tax=Phytophthora oleae TaxID=2107226 RepID=A0ABD3F0J9_9STRA
MARNRAILNAKLEETWGFMVPWCRALRHKLEYIPVQQLHHRRYPQVLVPLRGVIEEVFNFYDGSDTFQLVHEGLTLLAAVAHVDYKAWRYLLEKHCAVPLGQEGDELYEDEIPVHFLLILDRNAARRGWNKPITSFSPEEARTIEEDYATRPYTEDILEFFRQDSHSGAYAEILVRISALLQDNTRSVIQIPVQVLFSEGFADIRALKEIVKAETLLEEEKQRRRGLLARTESLRCSFVFEPTLVDWTRRAIDPDLCETLGAIVQGNVFLSLLDLLAYIDGLGDEEFGHLMRLLLNSDWHSSFCSPYRFGTVKLSCLEWLPNRGPEMVLSALATTRATCSLEFTLIPVDDECEVTGMWWKWIAYAFFSKWARAGSAVENLKLTWINKMLPSDMELFAAVVVAKNPEEVLFESPPGVVEAREATLQSGSLIHWQISTQGEAPPRTLTFEEPVPCVWTFSDDGESDWLNAVVPGYGRCLVQRRDLVFDSSTSVDKTGKGFDRWTSPLRSAIIPNAWGCRVSFQSYHRL